MKSVVLELQAMASNSDTSVSDLLRKTKVVAVWNGEEWEFKNEGPSGSDVR